MSLFEDIKYVIKRLTCEKLYVIKIVGSEYVIINSLNGDDEFPCIANTDFFTKQEAKQIIKAFKKENVGTKFKLQFVCFK